MPIQSSLTQRGLAKTTLPALASFFQTNIGLASGPQDASIPLAPTPASGDGFVFSSDKLGCRLTTLLLTARRAS